MSESGGVALEQRRLVIADSAKLDFRSRLLNAVAVVGVPVTWASALINLVLGSPVATVVVNAAAGFVILGLLWFARSTGRYRLTYLIAVIGLFVVVFPWLFFSGGGLNGGMPVFFMFAIAFSAIILEGVALWVVVPLQAAIFTGSLFVAYWFPASVTPLPSLLSVVVDIAFAVLATGLALVVALRMFIGLYESNKAQLIQRNEELAGVDQAKTEFLAMVAHELNTPLTVIGAHSDEGSRDLKQAGLTELRAAQDLTVISAETDRLGRLVSQLLDLARINDHRLVVVSVPQNLDEIIQQTLQRYRPLWTQNGNTVEVSRGNAAPVVMVDRERVVQVLVNLLSNAAQHTVAGTIGVVVSVAGQQAEVTISDTGEGISPEMLKYLGQRPVRDRPGGLRSARDAGLGVGLMISAHIVAAHGGQFQVHSEVGEGTDVRFTLPLAEAAPAPL